MATATIVAGVNDEGKQGRYNEKWCEKKTKNLKKVTLLNQTVD